MADNEHRDEVDAEPAEAAPDDGDAEPGAAADRGVSGAPGAATDGPGEGDVEPETGNEDAADDGANPLHDLAEHIVQAAHSLYESVHGPTLDTATADAAVDDLHAHVLKLLSGTPCPMCEGDGVLAEEPPADPRAERCPDCKGRGKVYTGSLVPESAVRPCGKCAGAGFTEKAREADVVTLPAPPPPPPSGAQFYDANDPATWHLPLPPHMRGVVTP